MYHRAKFIANSQASLRRNISVSITTECNDTLVDHFIATYPIYQWELNGYFNRSELSLINCHWMTFEPMKGFYHFMLAFTYVVFFVYGLLNNTVVIFVIARLVFKKIFYLDIFLYQFQRFGYDFQYKKAADSDQFAYSQLGYWRSRRRPFGIKFTPFL